MPASEPVSSSASPSGRRLGWEGNPDMMSVPHDPVVTSDADVAEQSLRVHLKPTTPDLGGTGHVDGAWWPRSRDLTAELPTLIAALATRLGAVERVAYNLDEWPAAVRRFEVGAKRVRLEGFHSQGTDTVDAIGTHGRVTILVIPPGKSAETAKKIALAAADGHNTESVDTLLARAAGGDGMRRAQRPPA
jgi:hypothetical protein